MENDKAVNTDDKAKAPEGTPEPKKADAKDEIIPRARLDAEVARRHEAEKKLEALNKKAEEDAKKALLDQNKFKELYEQTAPKAKMAEEMEASVALYFAEESEGLSDDHKALIPEGPVHMRLAWLKKAKKAGMFGPQNPTDKKTFGLKPKNGVQPDKWYLEIKSDDPRFETLTGPQYQEWKAHNRQETGVVRGGF